MRWSAARRRRRRGAGLRVGVFGRRGHLHPRRGTAAIFPDLVRQNAGGHADEHCADFSVRHFHTAGWYQKLAAKAGAGTLVPITGFANSVVSPAIEFKAEGWVTGVGARIFGIAGPVIAFGTLASFVWGVLYWLLGKVG